MSVRRVVLVLAASWLAVTGLTIATAPPAAACTCDRLPPAMALSLPDHDVVFSGEVVELDNAGAVLRTAAVYRGSVTATAAVRTHSDCAPAGEVGERWIVRGVSTGEVGIYDSSACSIVSVVAEPRYTERLLGAAGPGHAPEPGGPRSDEGASSWVRALGVLAGCAGAAAVTLTWRRRRRRTNPARVVTD